MDDVVGGVVENRRRAILELEPRHLAVAAGDAPGTQHSASDYAPAVAPWRGPGAGDADAGRGWCDVFAAAAAHEVRLMRVDSARSSVRSGRRWRIRSSPAAPLGGLGAARIRDRQAQLSAGRLGGSGRAAPPGISRAARARCRVRLPNSTGGRSARRPDVAQRVGSDDAVGGISATRSVPTTARASFRPDRLVRASLPNKRPQPVAVPAPFHAASSRAQRARHALDERRPRSMEAHRPGAS